MARTHQSVLQLSQGRFVHGARAPSGGFGKGYLGGAIRTYQIAACEYLHGDIGIEEQVGIRELFVHHHLKCEVVEVPPVYVGSLVYHDRLSTSV